METGPATGTNMRLCTNIHGLVVHASCYNIFLLHTLLSQYMSVWRIVHAQFRSSIVFSPKILMSLLEDVRLQHRVMSVSL